MMGKDSKTKIKIKLNKLSTHIVPLTSDVKKSSHKNLLSLKEIVQPPKIIGERKTNILCIHTILEKPIKHLMISIMLKYMYCILYKFLIPHTIVQHTWSHCSQGPVLGASTSLSW